MSEPKTMQINDVEYVRKDSIPKVELPKGDFAPYEIGEEYFIQTVTHYYLGRLICVTDGELIIDHASWVASTGKFNEFMGGSNPKENEPFQECQIVIVGRGAIVAAVKREICLVLK